MNIGCVEFDFFVIVIIWLFILELSGFEVFIYVFKDV
jgi:hypothetical protein